MKTSEELNKIIVDLAANAPTPGHAPDEDTHVIVMHPQRWYDLATENPRAIAFEVIGPGWDVLGHRVEGTFRNIAIILSASAPPQKLFVMEHEDLKSRVYIRF